MKTETTDSSSYIYVFHMLSIQNRHVNSTHYADTKWEMEEMDQRKKTAGWQPRSPFLAALWGQSPRNRIDKHMISKILIYLWLTAHLIEVSHLYIKSTLAMLNPEFK